MAHLFMVSIEKMICIACEQPAPELGRSRRVCDECHKRAAEARARPFVMTSARRRKEIADEIDSWFDYKILERRASALLHDNALRVERQELIQKQRIEDEMGKRDTAKPKLPKYTKADILQYRKQLTDIINDCYLIGGEGISPGRLRRAATEISDLLLPSSRKKSEVDIMLILDLLAPYVKAGISKVEAKKFVNFIAGNYLDLRAGVLPKRWNSGVDELGDWSLIEIYATKPGYTDSSGLPGFFLGMEILSGPLAGEKLGVGYTQGVESRIARKFGVLQKDIKYAEPNLLVGMVGFGYLCLGFGNNIRARSFASVGPQGKLNKALLQGRIYPANCKYHLKPITIQSCLSCPVGRDMHRFNDPCCKWALFGSTQHDQMTEEVKAQINS